MSGWIATVFCEAAGYVAAECSKTFAEEGFAVGAVEAGEAGLQWVCCYAVADRKVSDVLPYIDD